jgi:hypothetical protein
VSEEAEKRSLRRQELADRQLSVLLNLRGKMPFIKSESSRKTLPARET